MICLELRCDCCGLVFPLDPKRPHKDHMMLRHTAKLCGWVNTSKRLSGGKDYCPNCKPAKAAQGEHS